MAASKDDRIGLAVIGFGSRATTMVAAFKRAHPRIELVAVANPDFERPVRLLKDAGMDDEPRFFRDTDDLLDGGVDFDALLIGTPCDLHTPLAVKVASTGLPLFLEKPIAIDYEQLTALRDVYKGREKSVVVSFPLRLTPIFTAVMDVVRSGRLGTINQVQAINNVPYGGTYYAASFYREHSVTGGLWLQKTTHDFDYINAILGRPDMITAMASRKVYGGDMPQNLWCSACDLRETCPESPIGLARRGDDGGLGWDDHLCVFGDGIKHQDAGSALIAYEGGIHAA